MQDVAHLLRRFEYDEAGLAFTQFIHVKHDHTQGGAIEIIKFTHAQVQGRFCLGHILLKGLDQAVERTGIPLAAHVDQGFALKLMGFDLYLAHCGFLDILLEAIVSTSNPPMQSLFCGMAPEQNRFGPHIFASNQE
jgi:hypothetical protein